ncbi:MULTISPECIES: type II toxin-antitoxin system RelE family toxin [Citrobacter]|uniref:type II toxin-antitoxin system RelE family toxin n=1 Tax=Citrobacter TaxID=544 RepID=UPI00227B8BA4|nr:MULTISPECIES: type II toxin-antitoxin system RelE/ParE family toxin [Citrobacter]EKQ7213294.1 type II toxin-antitoxin system RelE/ParE family toxin [Citrobacter freundii]ELK6451448.1 type II toxin-antitoxin system RelE/ParE family toxin [Citrobacter freundii]MDC8910521.1 type II toxin-antitoxin system RelE/ParE family toxin [Citrobacter freundii]MDM2902727.1 type II toxin-antitoxin system RelE/ParE family toxin [Citrobacter sp. Cpo037]MDM3343733.1 type II toxin-antitoxin system RelE/ParE fa
MPKVEWSKKAKKQLSRIDSRYREMIFDKVGELEDFPDVQLDLKKIQGSKDKEYRVRVGVYRVLFTVIDGKPIIIRIDEVMRRQTNTY